MADKIVMKRADYQALVDAGEDTGLSISEREGILKAKGIEVEPDVMRAPVGYAEAGLKGLLGRTSGATGGAAALNSLAQGIIPGVAGHAGGIFGLGAGTVAGGPGMGAASMLVGEAAGSAIGTGIQEAGALAAEKAFPNAGIEGPESISEVTSKMTDSAVLGAMFAYAGLQGREWFNQIKRNPRLKKFVTSYIRKASNSPTMEARLLVQNPEAVRNAPMPDEILPQYDKLLRDRGMEPLLDSLGAMNKVVDEHMASSEKVRVVTENLEEAFKTEKRIFSKKKPDRAISLIKEKATTEGSGTGQMRKQTNLSGSTQTSSNIEKLLETVEGESSKLKWEELTKGMSEETKKIVESRTVKLGDRFFRDSKAQQFINMGLDKLDKGTLTPQEALWGRQAASQLLKKYEASRASGMPESVTMNEAALAKYKDQFDNFLIESGTFPELRDAHRELALSFAKEHFDEFFPHAGTGKVSDTGRTMAGVAGVGTGLGLMASGNPLAGIPVALGGLSVSPKATMEGMALAQRGSKALNKFLGKARQPVGHISTRSLYDIFTDGKKEKARD